MAESRIENFHKLVDYQLDTPIDEIKQRNPEYQGSEFNTKESIIKHMMNKSKSGEHILLVSESNNCEGPSCGIMRKKGNKENKENKEKHENKINQKHENLLKKV